MLVRQSLRQHPRQHPAPEFVQGFPAGSHDDPALPVVVVGIGGVGVQAGQRRLQAGIDLGFGVRRPQQVEQRPPVAHFLLIRPFGRARKSPGHLVGVNGFYLRPMQEGAAPQRFDPLYQLFHLEGLGFGQGPGGRRGQGGGRSGRRLGGRGGGGRGG